MAKRILLVDDESSTTFLMKFGFEHLGYEVTCAADGEEAWSLLESQKPDVILTDLRMPRLGGLELAARVRRNSQTRDIPIVMFTFQAPDVSEEEIRKWFGIEALLPKPFDPRGYARVIDRVLMGRSV